MSQPVFLYTARAADLLEVPEQKKFTRAEESRAAEILVLKFLENSGSPAHFRRRDDGLPLWPDGYGGSISHCRGEIAVAARCGAPLGIDMEKISRVTPAIFDRIATPAERAAAETFPDAEIFSAILFCAKEAAWKLIRNYIVLSPGWQDINVTPLAGNRLHVRCGNMDMHGIFLKHKDMLIVLMEKQDEGTFPDPSWIAQ